MLIVNIYTLILQLIMLQELNRIRPSRTDNLIRINIKHVLISQAAEYFSTEIRSRKYLGGILPNICN